MDANGVNILLVDDRPENTMALEATLAPLGHNLVSVNSGEAALREVLRIDFAVIIMDVRMPGMDGYETANMIKARGKSKNTPIIFVSASGEEPVKGYAVGAVDYIAKPYDPEILRAKVGAFVELYKTQRELEKARSEMESRVERRTLALRESEARYKRITDGITDYQYTVRLKDSKVFETIHSPACENVTGYTPEEFTANPDLWIHMVHPDDRKRISDLSQAVLDGNDLPAVEHRITTKTGKTRWISNTIIPFRDTSGKLLSYDGIIKDITARKEWEYKLTETNQKLQQALDDVNKTHKMLIRSEKLAAMGQLSAGVAHELKNPLNIISTSTQLMMMEEGLTGEMKETCRIITEQVMRAVKIIDNLRDFARERKPEMMKIDLCQLINKTMSLVAYEMKCEGISVTGRHCPEPVYIVGDQDQLAQVFLNIINNARDSLNMRRNSLSVEERERIGWKAELAVHIKANNETVDILFEDNGVGISEENRRKIFTPFFTTKGETKGTGLGMAIAFGIIENHGGTIAVESEEGKGAVFTVRIPLAGEQEWT